LKEDSASITFVAGSWKYKLFDQGFRLQVTLDFFGEEKYFYLENMAAGRSLKELDNYDKVRFTSV